MFYIKKKSWILFKVMFTAIFVSVACFLCACATVEDTMANHFYKRVNNLLWFDNIKSKTEVDKKDNNIKKKLEINNKRMPNTNMRDNMEKSGMYINEEMNKTIAEMEKLNKENVLADDPRLVTLIRRHIVAPPSHLPYNLSDIDVIDTSRGQAPFVDSRLEFKEGGFFVESGAHDGEQLSNTLFLERVRGWTGILIEPLPAVFQKLKNKHRKSYILNACLSPKPHPSKEFMSSKPVIAKILNKASSHVVHPEGNVQVQCFPLYSILLALNQTTVDFLSLDVEGVEKGVLDSIPWRKVDIKMMAVEYDKWPGGDEILCRYIERKGYKCLVTLKAEGAADVLIRKKKMY